MDATIAPSNEYVRPPTSGAAITAFILSLIVGLVSMIGVWWANLLPVLIALLAWPAISAGRRRGGGFAIAAIVISALAAVGVYMMWRGAAKMMEQVFGHALSALDKGDETELRLWVPEGEDPASTVARWRGRMDALHGVAGAYRDETHVRQGLFGPAFALVTAPEGVTEIGGSGPKPDLTSGSPALWVQATFEKGPIWVAFELHKGKSTGDLKSGAGAGQQRLAIFTDIRFFKPAD